MRKLRRKLRRYRYILGVMENRNETFVPRALPGDEAHCWVYPVAGKGEGDGDLQWLDKKERDRLEAFRCAEDASLYRQAHLFQRRVLAGYVNGVPGDLVFARGPHGKPLLKSHGGIHFNLSHTSGMVVLAVSRHEIGVDVERCDRPIDVLKLAERFFCEREYEAIRDAGEAQRRQLFVRYWTCKEACIKAEGTGLYRALKSFCIVPECERFGVEWCDSNSKGRDWRLWAPAVEDPFRLAVCTVPAVQAVRVLDAGE
jgi:4'-phosphopantetheinyl transferase